MKPDSSLTVPALVLVPAERTGRWSGWGWGARLRGRSKRVTH